MSYTIYYTLDFDDPSCDTVEECNIQGCCQIDAACAAPVDRSTCDPTTDWTAGADCLDTGECGDPLGCCFTGGDSPSCDNGTLAKECGEGNQSWSVGEMCNDAGTCGPIGCCQFAGGDTSSECANTDETTCDRRLGSWVVGGGPDNNCITEGANMGICPRNLTGCCVFGPDDCGQLTPDECESVGEFAEIGIQCTEVAECNIPPIVISPIPTLGQWGLIAMAGLLGLFSLFIIIRRHRFNVS